jgi:predicted nucleic acid-binding protein
MKRIIFLDTGYLIALSNTTVIPFTSEGMSRAFSLFKRRKDKTWGMVDCYSFVVMKKRRVRHALTFDDHFRQAGFDTPLIG